jgi:glycerophosphoryl diester phosphodiesterase
MCFGAFQSHGSETDNLHTTYALENSAADKLHDRFDEPFDLQAHRGGLGLVVESTLHSFANALEIGVSTLELDIQITEDGVAVVTHDRQVQGHKCQDTAPAFADDPEFPYVGKYIKDLTLAQVKTLDCGSLRLQDHPWQRLVPGVTMPTLRDVFELVHFYQADDVMLNIETKVEAGAPEETAPREEFVHVVLDEIERADIADQVTIQSFDWGALMLVRELEPSLGIVALTNGQSFLQCGEPGPSPWLGGIDYDDFNCDLVAAVMSFGADAISPVHGDPQNGRFGQEDYEPFTTPELVRRAHAHGIQVIPWTVNDRATAEYLVESGVDGIITDYPDQMRHVMQDYGLKLPKAYPYPEVH